MTQTLCTKYKKGGVTLFILIWYVKLGFNHILPLTIVIKAILTACHSSVVSLFNQEYSEIQAKTNLGKGTVGRSAKEVENNKEKILVVILPNFLLVIKHQSFRKFALKGWIMLFRPLDLYIPLFLPFTPQTVRSSEGEWFLLCNKKESCYVKEDTLKIKANFCKISSKIHCGEFKKWLVAK